MSNEISKELYKAGEYIFKEGDQAFDFFIIDSGQIEILAKNKEGSPVRVAVVSEGESFGEFALLDKTTRSASARAVDDCIVNRISEAGYEELLNQLPVWASCMLKSFAGRLKAMNSRVK